MSFITFRILFFSACLSLVVGPLAFWLTRRLKLVDMPGSAPHKLHDHPMPVAGGIVLYATLIIVYLFTKDLRNSSLWPILLSSSVVFFFGLWDDIRSLPVAFKLVGQVLAALLLMNLDVQVRLFQSNWLNIGITLLWIVGITNAYNFVDSMDGLATGLAALAAAFFMMVAIQSQQPDISLFSAVLLGACIGSFFYNAPPAHFFLGDSGSQLLGFILAGLSIVYNPLGFLRSQSWFIPILLVGVPIFDTTLVVFSRLRRGRPFYQGALDHTYHRLVALGMDSNRAVISMHVAATLLGCLAFMALDLTPIYANILFFACIFAGVVLILYLDSRYSSPVDHPARGYQPGEYPKVWHGK